MSGPEAEGSGEAEATVEPRDTGPFSEGEKVLAYHGPKIYEAKIQRAELRKKEWRYFIHYLGWSKSWDEWLEVGRLLKINEDNRSKQEESHGEKGKGRAKTGRDGKQEKDDAKVPGGRGKKRKHDGKNDATAEDREDEPEQVVKVTIPASLKKQLVDDWTRVNEEHKVVSLPAKVPVNEILRRYMELTPIKDATSNGSDMTGQVVDGMRDYFDRALPAMLLYKDEREHYNENFPDGTTRVPSNFYGAEHLLRLFVKLPELLVYTNMEEDAMGHLQQKLADFLKFLQKNQTTFFSSTYVPFAPKKAGSSTAPAKANQK